MATIGNPTKYQSNPYYESTGDGTTQSFTLGWTPGTTASMVVSVGGVVQPPSSYSVLGNVVTFAEAPPLDAVVLINGLGVKAMNTLAEANVVSKNAPTGAALMPTGSTAQRPSANPAGAYAYIRYNNEYATWEGSPDGTTWSGLGGATGGAGNPAFYENDTAITADYIITTGKNAMTAGAITIADGVTVTVPDGSTWTVV